MNANDILQQFEATIDYEWRREIARNEQLLRDRGVSAPEIEMLLEVCYSDWREGKKRQLAEAAAWLRGQQHARIFIP
jgi:hypothetical protein